MIFIAAPYLIHHVLSFISKIITDKDIARFHISNESLLSFTLNLHDKCLPTLNGDILQLYEILCKKNRCKKIGKNIGLEEKICNNETIYLRCKTVR